MKGLNEKKAALLDEMQNLLSTVESEERAFNEEEQAKFEEIENEIKAIKDTISKIESGRELTEEVPAEEETVENEETEEPKEEEEEMNEERTLTSEERAFANYIKNVRTDSDVNLTASDNGAVIPTSIAKKIIKKVYDISPLLEKSTKYNVKGKLEIPYYSETGSAKVNMAYATEFTDLTSNIGTFASIELTGYLAGALAKLSNSLINNSDFDIVEEVIAIMAESISAFVEGELIHGTENKVAGLKAGVTMKVEAAVAEINADDLIACKRKVKQRYQKDAIWIMHPETLTAISQLKDENGRYLLNDDINGDFSYTLLGKPVYESDNMDVVGTLNNIPVYYGDMSGLATKFSEELSIQVLREKFATQHATGVVAWAEFDGKVEDAQKIAKIVCKNA